MAAPDEHSRVFQGKRGKMITVAVLVSWTIIYLPISNTDIASLGLHVDETNNHKTFSAPRG